MPAGGLPVHLWYLDNLTYGQLLTLNIQLTSRTVSLTLINCTMNQGLLGSSKDLHLHRARWEQGALRFPRLVINESWNYRFQLSALCASWTAVGSTLGK